MCEQRITDCVRALHAEGFTMQQLTVAFENALRREYNQALSAQQLQALRSPQGRGNVEIIERIEADCLASRKNMPGQPQNKTNICVDDLDPGGVRRPAILYTSDSTRREFFDAATNTTVFNNSTQHNAGADLVYLQNYNPDERSVELVLVQQKVGATPLRNGRSATNANRSAYFISTGLEQSEQFHIERLEEEYDVFARCKLEVHTTSPVGATARDEFRRHGVELYDSTRMWNEVWSEQIKATLVQLHGAQRAKGLGVLL